MRGKHPNSRNGFKKGNSKGVSISPETAEDKRRLHLFKFAYKRRAKRKNLVVSLTDADFLSIVKGNCHYCGVNYQTEQRLVNKIPVNMLTVDRKDSSKGYTLDNCVGACKQCNTIKMDYSYDDFIAKIRQILSHLNT